MSTTLHTAITLSWLYINLEPQKILKKMVINETTEQFSQVTSFHDRVTLQTKNHQCSCICTCTMHMYPVLNVILHKRHSFCKSSILMYQFSTTLS